MNFRFQSRWDRNLQIHHGADWVDPIASQPEALAQESIEPGLIGATN